MTGREKIQAAFSKEGTCEIPAVICYEDIFLRDHWRQFTSHPWWYFKEVDIHKQFAWRKDLIAKTGQDWFVLPVCSTKEERNNFIIQMEGEEVYKVDKRNGNKERLWEPIIGGKIITDVSHSTAGNKPAETREDIDKLLPSVIQFDPELFVSGGRKDLAGQMLQHFGKDLCPIRHITSPLWNCYKIWGFEGMMMMVADHPELVEYVCKRYTEMKLEEVKEASVLGTEVIWIEECFTDMINPDIFKELNVPYMVQLVEAIRETGMKSIYYFTGNPAKRFNHILSIGADALAFEESKKGFSIDIEELVMAVDGRCAILGNLDSIGVLQDGTEENLREEITRQIAAGKKNGGRFIMSLGSPVTPLTSVERVRLYCDLVHELGKK